MITLTIPGLLELFPKPEKHYDQTHGGRHGIDKLLSDVEHNMEGPKQVLIYIAHSNPDWKMICEQFKKEEYQTPEGLILSMLKFIASIDNDTKLVNVGTGPERKEHRMILATIRYWGNWWVRDQRMRSTSEDIDTDV